MFAQTWRKHWGLSAEPFVHEDADKDPILSRIDAAAAHSSFDRIYGNPETPGPGIVFGEKGSGKSGLRLALQRRIAEHNQTHPDSRVFVADYTSFDYFLDQYRQAAKLPPVPNKSVPKILDRFGIADHLDSILSVGVTALADELIEDGKAGKKLDRKFKIDLLTLASLYYDSKRRARDEALHKLHGALRFFNARKGMRRILDVLVILLGVVLVLVPHAGAFGIEHGRDLGSPTLWHGAGIAVLAALGIYTLVRRFSVHRLATSASRSIRVLPREPKLVAGFLDTLPASVRRGIAVPVDADEATRYHLLQRFLGVLEPLGYSCAYILMDRVDESTVLAGKEEWIRPFVEKILDHRLLQHPGLGCKFFLPIELAKVYMGASPEELKRMRLDKANTIQELRWTGQELYEIANQRLRAARDGERASVDLREYFEPGLDPEDVKETLHELGTPRHAFGFLSALFSEYCRNLPDELESESPDWRVTRSHFDVVRSAWADRARVLRRAMN